MIKTLKHAIIWASMGVDDVESTIDSLKKRDANYLDIDKAFFVDASSNLANTVQTSLNLLKRYNNWYILEDEYYYLKKMEDVISFMNELLGQYLSEYMEVPTIEYHIVQKNGKIIGLLSKNFKSTKYNYSYGWQISMDLVYKLKDIIENKDFEYNEDIRKQFTAYLVKNYYSALKDRLANSIYAHNSSEEFRLAPSYDYESSFIDSEMLMYLDPLIKCTFNHEMSEFLKRNNIYYAECLEKIFDFNIVKALKNISEKHSIIIPNDVQSYYENFDRNRKSFMKKMGVH